MEDATIEDEIEDEQSDRNDHLNQRATLLPWSTIFHIRNIFLVFHFKIFNFVVLVSQQWMIFIIISLIIGFYLYFNAKQRKIQQKKKLSISRDHFQNDSKKPKRTLKKD